MPKQGPKSGKSSKTARVLSLLTDPDAVEESAEASAPEKKERGKLADDRRAQANIRGALEAELEDKAPAAPAKAAPRAPKAAPKAPKAAPKAPKAPMKSARAAALLEDDEPEEESAPMPAIAPPAARPGMQNAVEKLKNTAEQEPDEFICYNVTQALVEDKADKYIKMFGLCTCARCRIDVIALALSNLPPKYVVAKPHELIPRLSMYEQKYNAAVVTQVMSACKKVLDRPHHERDKS